jgi:hypothetical protein
MHDYTKITPVMFFSLDGGTFYVRFAPITTGQRTSLNVCLVPEAVIY